MKNEQQEQAKGLYFQTDMSKTEIAGKVGVDRRTVLLWARNGNWDKLRASARHLPSIVAEKCYYLINNFAGNLLADSALPSAVNLQHAQTIHLLASSIKKLKNRSTVNESMEMFGFFMEGLQRRNPQLAEALLPEVEEYITVRENQEVNDFLLDGFNPDGSIPFPEKEIQEKWADNREMADLAAEFEIFVSTRPQNAVPGTVGASVQQPSASIENGEDMSTHDKKAA